MFDHIVLSFASAGFVNFITGLGDSVLRSSLQDDGSFDTKVTKLEKQLQQEVLARSRVGSSSHELSLAKGFAFLDRRHMKEFTVGTVRSCVVASLFSFCEKW